MARAGVQTRHAVTTKGLDQHIGYIKSMVDKSIRDGESRQLAVKLVSSQVTYGVDRRTGEEVPMVRAYGRNFLAPTPDICRARDEQCEIEKIWDFLVLNCRYVFDPKGIDTFVTLKENLLSGGADCDDATIAFATLLGVIGFSVNARVISTKEEPDVWAHIYPMVGITKDNPTKWLPLDITVEGATPGWEYRDIARRKDYILI
jgi:hypothetical protein